MKATSKCNNIKTFVSICSFWKSAAASVRVLLLRPNFAAQHFDILCVCLRLQMCVKMNYLYLVYAARIRDQKVKKQQRKIHYDFKWECKTKLMRAQMFKMFEYFWGLEYRKSFSVWSRCLPFPRTQSHGECVYCVTTVCGLHICGLLYVFKVFFSSPLFSLPISRAERIHLSFSPQMTFACYILHLQCWKWSKLQTLVASVRVWEKSNRNNKTHENCAQCKCSAACVRVSAAPKSTRKCCNIVNVCVRASVFLCVKKLRKLSLTAVSLMRFFHAYAFYCCIYRCRHRWH